MRENGGMEETKPRSRFRFSLRSLLLVVLVAAAYCGGLAHASRQYRDELSALKEEDARSKLKYRRLVDAYIISEQKVSSWARLAEELRGQLYPARDYTKRSYTLREQQIRSAHRAKMIAEEAEKQAKNSQQEFADSAD